MSQASVFVCAYLYLAFYEEDVNETEPDIAADNLSVVNATATKLTQEQLQMSVGILFAIFGGSFALFLAKIERKYVKTFFSTETGHARAKRFFLEGKDDYTKTRILKFCRYQWTSIRPQVAEWLDSNWDKWEREKPDWFNVVFIASIDDDIMPARALVKEKLKAEGGSRRRSSFMETLGGVGQEPQRDDRDEKAADSDDTE